MLKNIPQNRLLIYVLLLGLLPFLFVLFNYSTKNSQLNEIQTNLDYIKQRAYSLEQKQAQNISLRNYYRNADHFYIDKYLEAITFQEPEIENLKSIMKEKNFTSDKAIEKRLEFLTSSANHLSFVEGVVQTYPFFQETTETLAHPVEVNVEDIKKILARIEGIKIGNYEPGPNPPQLLILDFKIDKKTSGNEGEVYILNMKLLKREFT
jgi:hypothetical protein